MRCHRRDAGVRASTLRRDKFKDQRVRRAFNLAFPFEEMNRTIFYGSVRAALELFLSAWNSHHRVCRRDRNWRSSRSIRDKVPASVFTTAYQNPVNDTPDAVRNNLREADRLLQGSGLGGEGTAAASTPRARR